MGGGAPPMMMMGMGGGPMMGGAPPGAMMMPPQAQAQQAQQMNIPPLPMPEGEMVEKIGQAISNRLHNMKSSYKMFQDFLKLAINYTQALQTSSGCGRQMAAVLKKVSTGQGQPDIAAGYRALAELQHSTESRADSVIKAMQDDLLSSAQNVLTGGFKETCRFEQGFNQGYIKARSEILALPPNSIQRNQKLRDVEDKLANNLEILRGLERKVYCNFLLLWTAVLDAQAAAYRAAADAYGGAQKQWTQLAVSGDRIAPEPVDYKKVLADRRGEVCNGNAAAQMQMQMQQQQQQQQQMAFQQQQMMMRQSGVVGAGGMMPPQQQMQMRQPGAIGAHWGGGPPPNMMMQQNFMPKGVPELPENMRGARLELQQQYKKIPKFDDLDESGLDAWELPDVQFDQSGRDRGSSMSMSTSEDSMRGSFGASARASAAPMMGGGGGVGGGGGGGARARNSSVTPAAAAGAKSPPTARKLAPDVVCIAKALYAYKANNDDEHSFAAGEVFEVISKDSENWWTGRNPANGLTLLLPSNYMKESSAGSFD